MKIALGLDAADKPENITAYIKEGAGEFFAGFIPESWYNRYGWEISLNRRYFGPQNQFTGYDQLKEVISEVHSRNKEIFITFNTHQYCDEQMPFIKEIILNLEKLNPDGYIVADLALILELRRWGIQRPLHLSTGAACFNSETVRYLSGKAGVSRVNLPRKMNLKEMEFLIKNTSGLGVEYEVMIISYRCFFNDEFCFSWHSGLSSNLCAYFAASQKYTHRRFPPLWKQRWEKIIQSPEVQFEEGSDLDLFLKEIACEVNEPERLKGEEKVQHSKSKGIHPSLALATFKNCGICAIPKLKEMGVASLKVPVRGEPEIKLKYLKVVRQAVDHPAATREYCRGLINSESFCSGIGNCYYYTGQPEGG